MRNVILVIADDLGADKLSTHLSELPTFSKLVASGVSFSQAWAHPVCSPTRASIYTGLHPCRTGIGWAVGRPDVPAGLPSKAATLAELAAAKGIRSGLFGKWHLGDGTRAPIRRGWARHDGTLSGAFTGGESYCNWTRDSGPNDLGGYKSETSEDYATKVEVDAALDWLSQGGCPFWLTLAFHAPHSPYHMPNATYDGCDPKPPGASPSDLFLAMTKALDAHLGRLIQGIPSAERGRTLVIVVGDNGTPAEVAGERREGRMKGSVYSGGLHVPLIVADLWQLTGGGGSPDLLVGSPGRSSDAMVHAVDLFATISEALGVGQSAADSISLLPLVKRANAAPTRSSNFSQGFYGSPGAAGIARAALRDAHYKLLFQYEKPVLGEASARYELYDVADKLETTDLAPQIAQGGTLASGAQRLLDALLAGYAPGGPLTTFPAPASPSAWGNVPVT